MRRNITSVLPLIALLVATAGAFAQGGRRIMVAEDSGDGAEIMHMSLPDFRALREPDYRRADLPVFEEKLVLDSAQRVIVRELIEQYLEDFNALAREKLGGSGADDAEVQVLEGPDGESAVMIALGSPEGPDREIGKLMEDTAQSMRKAAGAGPGQEVGGQLSVMITAGTEGGGEGEGGGIGATAGEGDEPRVSIAFGGPEGAELPEEVRKQLEARAQEIAEKLQKQMAERMAAGEGIGPSPERFEQQRVRLEELAERAQELEKEKKRLARRFVTDVQMQLAEEQLARWPALERKLTRIKTLPTGRFDGERTDLLAILEDMSLTEQDLETIAETAEAYELTLHQALVQRNAFIPEAEQKIDEAIQARRFDKAGSLVERAASTRVAVRRVNEDFAEALAQELPEASAEDFRERVRRDAFPRVHRETWGDRAFATVNGLALGDPTADVVRDLETAYRIERARVDGVIVRTIRREQPAEQKRRMERLQAQLMGEPVEGTGIDLSMDGDAVAEAFERRTDLDRKYIDLLGNLLTPEQAALLPRVPEQRGPVIIRSTP